MKGRDASEQDVHCNTLARLKKVYEKVHKNYSAYEGGGFLRASEEACVYVCVHACAFARLFKLVTYSLYFIQQCFLKLSEQRKKECRHNAIINSFKLKWFSPMKRHHRFG